MTSSFKEETRFYMAELLEVGRFPAWNRPREPIFMAF